MVPSASTEPSCSTVTLRAEAAHEFHVVLDHARPCASPARSRISSAVASVSRSVMPATGSSSSKKLLVLDQQHADLEPLLLAVRSARRPARRARSARPMRPSMASIRSRCSPRRGARTGCGQVPRAVLQRQFEILEHGEIFEHGRLLEFAADAEIGDRALRRAGSDRPCRRTGPRRRRAGSCR